MTPAKTTQASPELLANFIPFSECSQDELIVLADHAWVDEVKKGYVVAQSGSSDEWDLYLIEGTLKLVADDGKETFIMGGSRTARASCGHLQPRHYTISAITPVRFLRVDNTLLKDLTYSVSRTGVRVEEVVGFPNMKNTPLFTEIYDDLINDRLVVPSMPEVALKIRHLIEDEDVPVPQLAKVLNIDPAISAKLIKSANGALYHGQPAVDTCARAISRLGLNTTKHLVISFVMRNLFCEKIHTELLNQHARDLWFHSVEVAAISMALAHVTPGMDAEEALLAGLLHDIGELVILSYAENYPELIVDSETLDGVIKQLKAEIGAVMLREWQFPEAIIEAAYGAEEWTRDSGEKPDYCDVVLTAQLHSFFGTPKMEGIPALEDIPAFSKLAGGNLTPEISMKILDEAKEQIFETKQLFL